MGWVWVRVATTAVWCWRGAAWWRRRAMRARGDVLRGADSPDQLQARIALPEAVELRRAPVHKGENQAVVRRRVALNVARRVHMHQLPQRPHPQRRAVRGCKAHVCARHDKLAQPPITRAAEQPQQRLLRRQPELRGRHREGRGLRLCTEAVANQRLGHVGAVRVVAVQPVACAPQRVELAEALPQGGRGRCGRGCGSVRGREGRARLRVEEVSVVHAHADHPRVLQRLQRRQPLAWVDDQQPTNQVNRLRRDRRPVLRGELQRARRAHLPLHLLVVARRKRRAR
mmetsp:Transcript_8066/g.20761  ORF Transcript_8066/g.20761 Transcript_8066/m.20761 type:complete len:285 (-) Transcript_8066:736-1590(-)